MASPLKKVVGRVKTIAREARDIPTAWATTVSTQQDYRAGNPADRQSMKANMNRASKNWDKQLAEVARAVVSGKTGSSSDIANEYGKYKKGKRR